MKILYVNHTAAVSGGERSLLDLLAALPAQLQPRLAAPDGPLRERAQALDVPWTGIRGTAGSLRLHPLHTPQALAEMASAAWQLRRAAASFGADLVHANSIRAGVVLGLARPRGVASVVHVRDCLPAGRVSAATMQLIAKTATVVVANSRYTADALLALAPQARVEVVHNPVDLARFDPRAIDRAEARARLSEAGARPVLLGVVAQLSPWKGQDAAIEALALLRTAGIDAQLLLIGSAKFLARSTRFDNERYVAGLRELIAREGLGEQVSWLGEREDVPQLMRALDVLLLPSWEEPFGRAVIEAMALGVPVIATDVGGPREIITDGREGYLLAPREPAAWARAIERIVRSSDGGAALGRAGRERVALQFTTARHVAAMIDVYEQAISEARSAVS